MVHSSGLDVRDRKENERISSYDQTPKNNNKLNLERKKLIKKEKEKERKKDEPQQIR